MVLTCRTVDRETLEEARTAAGVGLEDLEEALGDLVPHRRLSGHFPHRRGLPRPAPAAGADIGAAGTPLEPPSSRHSRTLHTAARFWFPPE